MNLQRIIGFHFMEVDFSEQIYSNLCTPFGLRDAITPIVSFSHGMGSKQRNAGNIPGTERRHTVADNIPRQTARVRVPVRTDICGYGEKGCIGSVDSLADVYHSRGAYRSDSVSAFCSAVSENGQYGWNS